MGSNRLTLPDLEEIEIRGLQLWNIGVRLGCLINPAGFYLISSLQPGEAFLRGGGLRIGTTDVACPCSFSWSRIIRTARALSLSTCLALP